MESILWNILSWLSSSSLRFLFDFLNLFKCRCYDIQNFNFWLFFFINIQRLHFQCFKKSWFLDDNLGRRQFISRRGRKRSWLRSWDFNSYGHLADSSRFDGKADAVWRNAVFVPLNSFVGGLWLKFDGNHLPIALNWGLVPFNDPFRNEGWNFDRFTLSNVALSLWLWRLSLLDHQTIQEVLNFDLIQFVRLSFLRHPATQNTYDVLVK